MHAGTEGTLKALPDLEVPETEDPAMISSEEILFNPAIRGDIARGVPPKYKDCRFTHAYY
jgi:hypothetical protein